MPDSKPKPLQRIMEILKYEKREISAIYFYAILSGIVQLSLPLGIQSIVSFVLGGTVSTSLVLLIAFVVFGVFIYGYMQINQMKIIEKIEQQLYVRYSFKYAHLLPRLDLKVAQKHYLPEMVNRYFDIMSLQKGISKLLLDVPTAMIQIVVGMLLLTLYHPAFIFFGILLLLIIYLILYYTGNHGINSSLKESKHKYRTADHLEQVSLHAPDFKFFKEDFNLKNADERITDYLKARTQHFKVLLFQYWALIILKVLITAAMLIVGAVLLFNQQLNIGQFIAAEIVILLIINSVEKLIVNLDQVYDVITALEKINQVIELPEEEYGRVAFKSTEKGMNVELKNVSFSYSNGTPVLKQVSFTAAPGSTLVISGSSGAGKSTLLKTIAGLHKPDSGIVLIDGVPISQYDLQTLRSNIGIMMQTSDVFEGSLIDNIKTGREISYSIINKLADITGLTEFINKHPEGYDLKLYPGRYDLPSSITKKILLIRALAGNPMLLLLEYPALYLTKQQSKDVLDYVRTELKESTVILISDEEHVVDWCSMQLKLENGTIKTV